MKQKQIPKEWSVQDVQAAYSIAICNELIDSWGIPEDRQAESEQEEIEKIRDDIANTQDLDNDYRLTQLPPYVLCGGMTSKERTRKLT